MSKTITVKNVKFKAPKKGKYNSKQLKKGMKEESEHTDNKKVQKIIAEVHIDKNKNAYKKK
jgi:hypothetical protein